jgi:PAS domain S-box-containing protein
MSFLCSVAGAGAWFGVGPGLLVSCAIIPILTAIATHGKFLIPPHPDFAAIVVMFFTAILSSRIRTAQVRLRQVLMDANAALERKVEERTAELASARDWLRTTLKSIGDAVIATDKAGRITFMNEVAAALTGWTEEDAFERRLEEVFVIFNEETGEAIENPVERVLRLGLVTGLANHAMLLSRGGREIPIDDSAAPIRDETGKLGGVVLVFRDITEGRAATAERDRLASEVQKGEIRLREAARLESLGILAGGIAHDFKNLLVGIIGATSLALEMLPKTEPARDVIHEALRAGERAAVLTNQMLAYSGKGKFLTEAIDLSRAIRELLPLLARSHPATAIDCKLDQSLPAIQGDPGQIQQVAMNLILNALEVCSGNHGRVSISTRLVDATRDPIPGAFGLPAIERGSYVCLEVRDGGCGMSQETIEKIFDPFFTTKFTGRGLGLSAVLGIVRGHKGAILVNSEIGRGTTFQVYFPALCAKAKEDVTSTPLASVGGTGKILLVDDEEAVRVLGRRTLERCGYTVITAANGAEALSLFRQNADFDVVILDMTMPVMGGEETLDEINRLEHSARIIISSGFSSEEAAERFKGKQVGGFLNKPYTSAALAQKVNSVSAKTRDMSAD